MYMKRVIRMNDNVILFCKQDPMYLLEVFEKYNVEFKRSMRVDSLLKEIRNRLISERKSLKLEEKETKKKLSITKMKRVTRLSYPNHLSELQLELEYDLLRDEELNKNYLISLFTKINTILSKNLHYDDIINELKSKDSGEVFKIFSIVEYNNTLFPIFKDDFEHCDGLHYKEYRTYLYHSTNIDELYLLGKKYGLTIPKYFSKSELKKRLEVGLNDKGLLTNELQLEIDKANAKKIRELLEQYDLPSKSYLSKEEVIEYILKHNQELKYFYNEDVSDYQYGINEQNNIGLKELFDNEYLKRISIASETTQKQQEGLLNFLNNVEKKQKNIELRLKLLQSSFLVILVFIIILTILVISK